MGKRPPNPTVVAEAEGTGEDTTNGDDSVEAPAQQTTAQRLAASAVSIEMPPDRFGREAKHFTETRVLNRDVSHLLFQFLSNLWSQHLSSFHQFFVCICL